MKLFKIIKDHWLASFLIMLLFIGIAYAANTKLSALTELAGPPAGSDEMYLNDGGTSKKISVTNLFSYELAPFPRDSELGSNGLIERTSAGVYGIATEDTDYCGALSDKASLEGKLSDVANLAEADGDTYSGAHDFSAGTLKVPVGVNLICLVSPTIQSATCGVLG